MKCSVLDAVVFRFANRTAVPVGLLDTASIRPSALVTAVADWDPLWSIAMMSVFFSALSSSVAWSGRWR